MQVEGGCYCGAVRYRAEGEPAFRGQCHCRECQYITERRWRRIPPGARPGRQLECAEARLKKRVKKSSVASRNARGNLKDNEKRYTQLIDRVSRELSLDRNLIHAVVRVESAFDPRAVSRAGAVGLMQLMPRTAERYGVRDSRNPTQNVYAGVLHLRNLIQQFNDVVLALAAYNAGENAVISYGYKVPPYPETQSYVRKVLTFYRQYSNQNRAS